MIQFMKIFFYKYGSICEPDISDSFRRLGFEVIDEDMEIYNKNLLPSQCVETVSKKLIDGQFTFVFTINFFPGRAWRFPTNYIQTKAICIRYCVNLILIPSYYAVYPKY